METIFIALSNMSGVACASDRDHILYQINKTDGFTWLNRKSWYHHKDVGGQYVKLGV
jgi:hypothetical protein